MFYNINPESPGQKFGVFGFYAFLCSVRCYALPMAHRPWLIARRLLTLIIYIMNTEHTNHNLHITLDGCGERADATLRPGRCVVVSVAERGGRRAVKVSEEYPGDYVSECRKALLDRERELVKLRIEKENMKHGISRVEEENRKLKETLEVVLSVVGSDEVRRLLGRELPVSRDDGALVGGFAGECRVERIVAGLKGFVDSHNCTDRYGSIRWCARYWAVVWRLFVDLKWWRGTDVEFMRWVEHVGYPLKEDNFKQGKRQIASRMPGWYALPAASGDRYGQIGHELYLLFMGDPHLSRVVVYEGDHISHDALQNTVGRLVGGKGMLYRGYLPIALVDSPGRADSMCVPQALLLLRHRSMVTIGMIDYSKPGRRRRAWRVREDFVKGVDRGSVSPTMSVDGLSRRRRMGKVRDSRMRLS